MQKFFRSISIVFQDDDAFVLPSDGWENTKFYDLEGRSERHDVHTLAVALQIHDILVAGHRGWTAPHQ